VASTRSAVRVLQHRRGGRHRKVRWIENLAQHDIDPVGPAERLDGLRVPDGALLSEGAGFVFAVAGLQCGLLRKLQHLHPPRRPTMITGEGGGELGPTDLDHLPPP